MELVGYVMLSALVLYMVQQVADRLQRAAAQYAAS